MRSHLLVISKSIVKFGIHSRLIVSTSFVEGNLYKHLYTCLFCFISQLFVLGEKTQVSIRLHSSLRRKENKLFQNRKKFQTFQNEFSQRFNLLLFYLFIGNIRPLLKWYRVCQELWTFELSYFLWVIFTTFEASYLLHVGCFIYENVARAKNEQ